MALALFCFVFLTAKRERCMCDQSARVASSYWRVKAHFSGDRNKIMDEPHTKS